MADGFKISVKKQRLIDKLHRLVPAARIEVTKAAIKGAEDVATLARRLVPRDTGQLAATIQVEPKTDGYGAVVVAGDKKAYYARFVEFGTQAATAGGRVADNRKGGGRTRKSMRTHPGTKAQPFLFPAARLLKKKNMARIGRAITKAAKQVAG